jgi:hypothetical protein
VGIPQRLKIYMPHALHTVYVNGKKRLQVNDDAQRIDVVSVYAEQTIVDMGQVLAGTNFELSSSRVSDKMSTYTFVLKKININDIKSLLYNDTIQNMLKKQYVIEDVKTYHLTIARLYKCLQGITNLCQTCKKYHTYETNQRLVVCSNCKIKVPHVDYAHHLDMHAKHQAAKKIIVWQETQQEFVPQRDVVFIGESLTDMMDFCDICHEKFECGFDQVAFLFCFFLFIFFLFIYLFLFRIARSGSLTTVSVCIAHSFTVTVFKRHGSRC